MLSSRNRHVIGAEPTRGVNPLGDGPLGGSLALGGMAPSLPGVRAGSRYGEDGLLAVGGMT